MSVVNLPWEIFIFFKESSYHVMIFSRKISFRIFPRNAACKFLEICSMQCYIIKASFLSLCRKTCFANKEKKILTEKSKEALLGEHRI